MSLTRRFTASMTRATIEDSAGRLVAIIERSTIDPEAFHVHNLSDGRAIDVVTVTGWRHALDVVRATSDCGAVISGLADLASPHTAHRDSAARATATDSQGRPWPRTLGEALEGGERR